VIPAGAWVAALIVGFFVLMCLVILPSHPPPPFILIQFFVPLVTAGYLLLVGYVYGDARRRGMRYVMWMWLAILIPNGLGIILYFILREPLAVYCTHCGRGMSPGFAYCPGCGSVMARTCGSCHKVSQEGWSHCAFCGSKL